MRTSSSAVSKIRENFNNTVQTFCINASNTKVFANIIMKCVSVHLGYIDVSERYLKFAFKKTKHSKLQDSIEVTVALYVFNIQKHVVN